MTRFRKTCNNCTKKDTEKCELLDNDGKTIIGNCLQTWACCDLRIKNDEETERSIMRHGETASKDIK